MHAKWDGLTQMNTTSTCLLAMVILAPPVTLQTPFITKRERAAIFLADRYNTISQGKQDQEQQRPTKTNSKPHQPYLKHQKIWDFSVQELSLTESDSQSAQLRTRRNSLQTNLLFAAGVLTILLLIVALNEIDKTQLLLKPILIGAF